MAIQQAANIAGFWTPTDLFDHVVSVRRWEIEEIPVDDMDDGMAGPSRTHTGSAGIQNGGSRPELASIRRTERVVSRKQTRFQGLWWGAERIWMDELVRLKIDRTHLAPEGQSMFRKPALIGPTRQQFNAERVKLQNGNYVQSHDVGSRGTFMYIDGIFLAEVQDRSGSGVKRECRVSGKLFELADEDYIDDDIVTQDKGKGKAPGSCLFLVIRP